MKAAGTLSPQWAVVERIRTEGFLIGLELSPSVAKGAQSLRRKLNQALRLLSEDLYSKETHFVLELVQNADDNDYPSGVTPTLRFHLRDSSIEVSNNEIGFTEANVVALCSVGESTKSRKAGFIGEKGIGFKSVFTVSSRPEIHSSGFHFRFDRSDESHLLGYVVPEWVGGVEAPHGDETTIVLPAKPQRSFTESDLSELSDELLLFLRKVRRLEVWNDQTNTQQISERREEGGLVLLKSTTTSTDQAVETIRRFTHVRHSFSTADIAEEKRPDIQQSEIVLAFPQNARQQAESDPDSSYAVFAFLPIRDFGFRFLVQGDFLLSSSREDIQRNRPWNIRIRDQLVDAFVAAIPMFKKDSALSLSFLKYLPRAGEVTDPLFKGAADGLVAAMKQVDCVLGAADTWCKPQQVVTADADFRELFPETELRRVLGLTYLSPKSEIPTDVLSLLGVPNAGVSHLLGMLEHDTQLAQKPVEWFRRLYSHCARKAFTEAALKTMRTLACIRLEGGAVVPISHDEVFFPLKRGRKYGFEKELRVIETELLEGESSVTTSVELFLAKLGVRQPVPYELITSHILPKHSSDAWRGFEEGVLVGHVRYLKDHIEDYLRGSLARGLDREAALVALRASVWIRTKKQDEHGKFYHHRPTYLYLSNEYRSEPLLEKELGSAADPICFVSTTYLETARKSRGESGELEEASWARFMLDIGVNQVPTIIEAGGDFFSGREMDLLVTTEGTEQRRFIFQLIDQYWSKYYSRFAQARIPSGRSVIARPSAFVSQLRAVVVPTKRKKPAPMSQCYVDNESVRAAFGRALSYLAFPLSSADFLDALGVTYRVSSQACVRRLEEMRTTVGVTAKDVRAIYREMERHLDRDEHYLVRSFAQQELIYVSGPANWKRADEVVWESSSHLLDAFSPPLEHQYREHQTFFRKLGISRRLPEAKLVEALSDLVDYGDSQEAKASEALKIYRRLSRALREARATDAMAYPDWLESLQTQKAFLDHAGRLVEADNDLYINDDSRLAQAFLERSDISFLAVDRDHVPAISELVDACGIPRMSTSVSYKMTAAANAEIDQSLSRLVRHRTHDIMRATYSRASAAFERATNAGVWKGLSRVEVIRADTIDVVATLAGHTAAVLTDIYREENRIYLRRDTRSALDRLANEIALMIGAKPEFAEIVYRLLSAPNDSDLADFLEVRGIEEIPEEELKKADTIRPTPETLTDRENGEVDSPHDESYLNEVEPDSPNEGTENSNVTEAEPRPYRSERVTDFPSIGPGAARVGSRNEGDERSSRGKSGGDRSRRDVRQETGRSDGADRRGRLLSYAEHLAKDDDSDDGGNLERQRERMVTSEAATAFVLQSEKTKGNDVEEMSFSNEGFDIIRRKGGADYDEFIEVKGLKGEWTEIGVALTPSEMRYAENYRERYWLYVVEYASDPSRRTLSIIRDPFGSVTQFRFDCGWRSLSESVAALGPIAGMRIAIPEIGAGLILSVERAGVLIRLRIKLDRGDEVSKLYEPTRMQLNPT